MLLLRCNGKHFRRLNLRRFTVCAQSLTRTPYLNLAIRREDKSRWERRAPLVPSAIQQLIEEAGVQVFVQPSSKRAFTDEQYAKVGAIITEDLSPADIILGIKEVPIHSLIPGKTYVYFSHTHKSQIYNMPMLREVLERNIRLIDYELLTDETNQRVVKFGSFAGYAGFIDSLHGFGQRLLGLGYSTSFLHIGMSHTYKSLVSAKTAMVSTGMEIMEKRLPKGVGPVILGFLGDGNVIRGAQEILDCLPHRWISVKELPKLAASDKFSTQLIYAVKILPEHYIRHRESHEFKSMADYLEKGKKEYMSVFGTEIAPYLSILINGAFWSSKYPHYMNTADLQAIQRNSSNMRMVTVGDVSCDIRGGLEFFSHSTEIGNPFYYFDAVNGIEHDNVEQKGTQIMGVDILPSEFPIDSSNYFSKALYPIVKELITGNFDAPILSRATIASDGKLKPNHVGLIPFLSTASSSSPSRNVLLLGSGMVSGPLVNYLVSKKVNITIASNNPLEAKALAAGREGINVVELDISDTFKLNALVSKKFDVVVSFIPAPLHPIIAELCINHGVHLVTASYISPAMKDLDAKAKSRGVLLLNEIGLDPGIDHLSAMKVIDEVTSSGNRVDSFISWCGGLPAPEASNVPFGYKFSWSPRGVLTATLNDARFKLNEKYHEIPGSELLRRYFKDVPIIRGFNLEGLANRDSLSYAASYGLHDTDSLRNMFRGTLRYKGFSELMQSFVKLGFMDFKENVHMGDKDLSHFLPSLLSQKTGTQITDKASLVSAIRDITGSEEVIDALDWLDLLDSKKALPRIPPGYSNSPIDCFCFLFSHKLRYLQGERDMVIMHHEFGLSNGHYRTSTLVAYGDNESTAMAKTVGLPAAMAVELILNTPDLTKDLNGVLAPLHSRIYKPLLEQLDAAGIKFIEQSSSKSMSSSLYS